MEQHSGVWSWAVSAVVWSLPQLYPESGGLHPSGSLDKCLGTAAGKWEFPQDLIYGWSSPEDMAVLVTRADILGVSPHLDVSALT